MSLNKLCHSPAEYVAVPIYGFVKCGYINHDLVQDHCRLVGKAYTCSANDPGREEVWRAEGAHQSVYIAFVDH
jgi:hypothetical protein